jgi:hypothetical protein
MTASRCPARTGNRRPNAAAGQWRAELTTSRQLFAGQRLGIAGLILVSIPEPAVLAVRRRPAPPGSAGTSISTSSWLSRCAPGITRSAPWIRTGSAGNCQLRAFPAATPSGPGTRAAAQPSSMH